MDSLAEVVFALRSPVFLKLMLGVLSPLRRLLAGEELEVPDVLLRREFTVS